MDASDRELGIDREITRRDFLNGVGVALTSSLVAPTWLEAAGLGPGVGASGQGMSSPEQAPDYYPPALTGLRGSHPGSFEIAHRLRDARAWRDAAADIGESYDLVVVGGGISGLASAHFFRAAVGRQAKILVLDNHDDFGGHAKRNEFRINGLAKSIVFDQETFGQQKLVTGCWQKPWEEFARESPLNERAKRDLIRIMTEKVDYLSRPISSSTPRTSSSRLSSTTRCRSASTSGPRPRTSRWCFTCATSTTARATRVRSNGGRAGAG